MIIKISRGFIRLQIENKIITIDGEAYLPGKGPDFVVYTNTIKNWDAPFDGESINEKTKKEILKVLKKDAKKKKIKIEIE